MGCCIGTITQIETLERWPLEYDTTPPSPETPGDTPDVTP
jgi:hypothetical protein